MSTYQSTLERAQRIADTAGDAHALDIDGQVYVVCHDGTDIAERLARSQLENIHVIHAEEVATCDVCGTPTLTNAAGYPTGWYPDEDTRGNLTGFICPDCWNPHADGPAEPFTPAGANYAHLYARLARQRRS